jgi:hypothetical protein
MGPARPISQPSTRAPVGSGGRAQDTKALLRAVEGPPHLHENPRRLDQVAPMVALMTLGVLKAAPTLAMYKLEASSPRPNAMLAG